MIPIISERNRLQTIALIISTADALQRSSADASRKSPGRCGLSNCLSGQYFGVVNELNEVLTDEMKQAGSMVTKAGVAPVAEILNVTRFETRTLPRSRNRI